MRRYLVAAAIVAFVLPAVAAAKGPVERVDHGEGSRAHAHDRG